VITLTGLGEACTNLYTVTYKKTPYFVISTTLHTAEGQSVNRRQYIPLVLCRQTQISMVSPSATRMYVPSSLVALLMSRDHMQNVTFLAGKCLCSGQQHVAQEGSKNVFFFIPN
jgi:hypothetical protein